MNAKVESLSPTKVALTIEVEALKVKEEHDRVFAEMAKGVQLKGFRKGKAPRKLVEKRIDEEILRKELLARLMNAAFEESLKAQKIRPVSEAQVEVIHYKEGDSFTFKATFERWPLVKLPEYKALEMKATKRDVTDEEIQKVLENLRSQHATYQDLPEGTVALGRGAVVDLQGSIGGKPLGGASWQGLTLEIQKDWPVIPGLMENMIGMKAGESRNIPVTLPAGFGPDAAGKKADFNVSVHAVKEKKVPELDDAFAQKLGNEFKTVADLKVSITKQLESWHQHEEKNEALNKLFETWIKSIQFPVPEVTVEERLKHFERETLKGLESQGKSFAQFLKEKYPEVFAIAGGKEDEKINRALVRFRDELKPQAANQAKIDIILEEIAEKETLRVTQEEVNSEIGRLSQSFRMPPEAVAKALRDKNVFRGFLGGMLRAKAALLVRENLKINY